jgi:LPXTG-site transpeptidase (sortase) family protein
MNEEKRISLNDPVLLARLRGDFSPKTYNKRQVKITRRIVSDVSPLKVNITQEINNSKKWNKEQVEQVEQAVDNESAVSDSYGLLPETNYSKDYKKLDQPSIQAKERIKSTKKRKTKKRKLFRLDNVFAGLAVLLFVSGLYIAYWGLRSDYISNFQAQKLTAEANNAFNHKTSSAVSTVKPSASDISSYTVPAGNPRTITISKIGVYARVLNVGTDKNGALKAPGNVFDAAWYNQSALPGQPGATLIDGHVSSWTSDGVFHNLKKLASGDVISIENGGGIIYRYSVVQTKIYSSSNVDMTAAITPIVTGTSGLNIISCYGKVTPGTSEFNQRIIVFAKLIN